ncbi:rhodanese-like domain-containing protein [Ramlibacter pallidus]|uniref:PhnD/SsuA/transferrin family substrate-binding protein n=1 Tax=Ramlibacter pallidus TaxID=2780087 RepID=A0ABR9S8S3_9BURK|nr:rhodanese-like domain-containing protein [Ramlibacter pallidus]MBE7369809.1 PhnD/SsuA/transferrin family substrate-binding protein [Ramlibacter pallidus]
MASWKTAVPFIALLASALAAPALAQSAPPPGALRVLVNPGDSSEQSRYALYSAWKAAVEQALRKHVPNVHVSLSNDATADLGSTRAGMHDAFVGPAHVVGSAVRYGYKPVLGIGKPVQAVLVAPKDSEIGSLEQAKGKRLGLPLQDSVVTYLVRGEVNAANTTIKRHFASVYDTRYQDALLPCLQVRRCDVVAVEKGVFDRWVAAGEPVKAIMQSRPVPGLSLAIKDGAKPGVEPLQAALADAPQFAALLRGENAQPVAHKADDFKYVATLGYFTPRTLPGATVVDAKSVAQLLQSGATYVDTRTDAEFKAGHVPGAVLVPYVEKSAKDADFDATLDKFDLAKLGTDKNAELVFACNGAECWKSFKATQAALKAGYRKVYWFRGGFPEWRSSGMKFDGAAAQ